MDAASGLPLSADTRSALANASRAAWADPSRRYSQADMARRLLAHARDSVAGVIGCLPTEVAFTASADAALAAALDGCLTGSLKAGASQPSVVVSAVEDIGLFRAVDRLAQRGVSATVIECDRKGRVDPDRFIAAAVGRDTTVACLQMGNGEVGTRQDIDTVVRALAPAGVPLVTDARHVVGRAPLSSGWQALAADSRNWGGPPGVGILAVRGLVNFAQTPDSGPLGVEGVAPPVPAIAAAALALEETAANVEDTARACAKLTRMLREQVQESIPDCEVLGDHENRLGHILMTSFLYVAADQLVDELARLGWAVSSGASCTSDTKRPHHVLVAMGALTHGSLRVSLQPTATQVDVTEFAKDLAFVVRRIRDETGVNEL